MVEDGLIGTIIVKDLSRFGREQVEMGRLTQIVYPSLGVTFISIQENVNTAAKTGLEMMPFYNIFNEWYAEQTSKKVWAVWAMKAANGKRSNFMPNAQEAIIDENTWLRVQELRKISAARLRRGKQACFPDWFSVQTAVQSSTFVRLRA